MKIWKILFYILIIPMFLYSILFFEYVSLLNIFLVFSVFLAHNLKKFDLWWFLVLIAILIDIVSNFWLGTMLLSIVFVLLILLVFEKTVSNIFLDLVATFFAFILFRIFFSSFVFLQDTSSLPNFDPEFFLNAVVFAAVNICFYLILKTGEYFLKSYFRDNV